jgi:hypothetical protein
MAAGGTASGTAHHRIGDLATLFRLETRLLGRTRQLDSELDAIFRGRRGHSGGAFEHLAQWRARRSPRAR